MARPAHRPLCLLATTVGRLERCPGGTCAFWAEDASAGCRLGAVAYEIQGRRELAELLLELRDLLDALRRRESSAPAPDGGDEAPRV